MKKISKFLIIIMAIFLLCSCGNKEYGLIEISANDLKEAVYANNSNFVFAIINTDYDNYEMFLNDLKIAAERADFNVYYIDYKHVSSDVSSFIIYDIGYDGGSGQYFAVFENGKINNSGYYKDFESMYKKIYTSKYPGNLSLTSEEEQEDYIAEAKKLYSENKYNSARDLLSKAWPNEKAKEEYKSNPYYQLVGIWESYEFIDKDYNYMNFRSFYFLNGNDDYCLLYEAKNMKYDGFKKPGYDKLSSRYYYIKDDIIYMSNKDNGDYEPYYKIVNLDAVEFKLLDLKNKNKTITFQRRD